jgi:hypothetical protein
MHDSAAAPALHQNAVHQRVLYHCTTHTLKRRMCLVRSSMQDTHCQLRQKYCCKHYYASLVRHESYFAAVAALLMQCLKIGGLEAHKESSMSHAHPSPTSADVSVNTPCLNHSVQPRIASIHSFILQCLAHCPMQRTCGAVWKRLLVCVSCCACAARAAYQRGSLWPRAFTAMPARSGAAETQH